MDQFDDMTLDGGPPERSRRFAPGREIAHYRIERRLGGGGMGEVYLAEDLRLQRQVALKALAPQLSRQEEFRGRFLTEARAAARLGHPNITTVYAIEAVDDELLIAMEFVDGVTLKHLVRRGPTDPALVADIAVQCCQALAEAHRQKIIHRDIKCSNIMIDNLGRVKVMDFGLAKLMLDEDVTASAATVGTYQYMSPEQILGKEIDFRTDLFSLGVVLYELLTGQLPFRGKTVAEVTRLVASAPIPPFATSLDIPIPLQQVVYRCLQRDLHTRYQQASDIAADLAGGPMRQPVVLDASRHRVGLAVFPITDVASGETSHYYADSLTEEIIVRFSKIRALRVASRSSVFRYTADSPELAAVASRLGVDAFLCGRLRRVDGNVRLALELTRTTDGSVIWSDVMVRTPSELQDLQLEVVEKVTEALDVRLSAGEERTVVRRYTDHLEAYDFYLRGKFHARQRDRESLLQAVSYYEQALALDPEFTEARASLSVMNALLFAYGFDPSPHRAEQALALALTAVQQRQNSSESHLALGVIYRQNNITKGIREMERAVALDPANTEARHFLANAYVIRGRYPAAIAEEERALELDPQYLVSRAHLCRIYTYLDMDEAYESCLEALRDETPGRAIVPATIGWRYWLELNWPKAVESLEEVIRLEPKALFSRWYLVDSLIQLHEYARAETVLSEGSRHGSEHFSQVSLRGMLAAARGDRELAEGEFSRAEELLRNSAYGWVQERSPLFHAQMGVLAVRRGQLERALEHVMIAVGEGYGHYAGLEKDPQWLPLREVEAFRKLAASVRKRRVESVRESGNLPRS